MLIPLPLRGAACLARYASDPQELLQNAWGERVLLTEVRTPLRDVPSSDKGDAETGP